MKTYFQMSHIQNKNTTNSLYEINKWKKKEKKKKFVKYNFSSLVQFKTTLKKHVSALGVYLYIFNTYFISRCLCCSPISSSVFSVCCLKWTFILCFVVVLFCVSSQQKKKYKEIFRIFEILGILFYVPVFTSYRKIHNNLIIGPCVFLMCYLSFWKQKREFIQIANNIQLKTNLWVLLEIEKKKKKKKIKKLKTNSANCFKVRLVKRVRYRSILFL